MCRLSAVSGLAAVVVRPELSMTLPRSVADVLAEHVLFEVECIDRMYLNVYVPQLQRELGLIGFLRARLGCTVASTAPLAAITEEFGSAVRRFARDRGIPLVDFVKGQRKDDVMHEHLATHPGGEAVLFIGRAQDLLLGVEQGDLADLPEVVLDRVGRGAAPRDLGGGLVRVV